MDSLNISYTDPPDFPTIRLRVLSLGAGVQSTTMALMAAHGEISPMPDLAIFADTQWEPKAVYEHLEWLSSGNVLPFPVVRVSDGNIRKKLVDFGLSGDNSLSVPLYTKEGNRKGRLRRGCTEKLKVRPILREIRKRAGLLPNERVRRGEPVAEQWIGISLDESWRAKPAFEAWYVKRHPLLEKMMNRKDCLKWIEDKGYPEPPKSACLGCPFKSDMRWRELKENDPEGFSDAIEVDEALRNGGGGRLDAQCFLHRSCYPLKDVALTDEETGQDNMFADECEGMCGN